jgi:hypothetical protein
MDLSRTSCAIWAISCHDLRPILLFYEGILGSLYGLPEPVVDLLAARPTSYVDTNAG